MKRLNPVNINTPEEYSRIYGVRSRGDPDEFDIRRWKKLLSRYKGGKLIDLGCLDSLVPIIAKKKYPKAEVWGMDYAKEAIKEMQEKHPEVFYFVGDFYKIDFSKFYFDYIVAGEVLEHLEDPEKFIAEAMRVLKHGGTLALSTPYNEASEPGAVDGDRHIWSYDEKDMCKMLNPYGEVYIKIVGSKYFPIYKYSFKNMMVWCKKL